MSTPSGTRAIVLIAVLAATGCAAPQASQLTDVERAEIEAAVEAQVMLFAEGASQLDPEIQAAMMAPDVEFVDFARLTDGREANIAWATELFGNFTTFTFTWDEVSVEVLGPDIALATAIGSMRRERLDGRIQESNRTIFFTGLYKATEGQWLLTRGHLSGSIGTVG